MTDAFGSSDQLRSAKPLRYARYETFDSPLTLKAGGVLPHVTVAYETYGTLHAARDNAVLICHALSGDSHVTRHNEHDDPGWWELVVGPGKPIDTNRYFVICANVLGGCRGTTGPNSVNPDTGQPYGPDFPLVAIEDLVDVQRMLVDRLGIDKLFAVVGGSLGGHQTLCWATRYPDRLTAAAAIATGPRLTAQALAFDVVGRNAILSDPHFHHGQYYDQPTKPDVGLALARMLGHITYLSPQAMHEKFDRDKHEPRQITTAFEKKFSVGSYLAYQGDKFVERFDANSYIALSMAMDLFDLGADPPQLTEKLSVSQCRWLVLSFTSDWLFPASQSKQMVDALIRAGKFVSYCNVDSGAGHDAFLLADGVDRYGPMLRAFLDTTTTQGTFVPPAPAKVQTNADVFHQDRIDYRSIVELIEPGASVLDLGCGNGELLALLARRDPSEHLLGMDLDEHNILASMQLGFDVIQVDLEHGLPDLPSQSYDYVVLSQTLQTIVRTEAIVREMLRVGRKGIVSFPNFAYHKIRHALAVEGRSPASEGGLLHYAWYNTPNRRFLSVLDWQDFCQQRDIRIHQSLFFDTELGESITENANELADLAIFVISR